MGFLGLLKNIASIYAQNDRNQAQASLQSTLEYLSGGARMDSEADDPAVQAEAGLNEASNDTNPGDGLLETGAGALSQVANLLHRAATLSIEGSDGLLNPHKASVANQEYQDILTEIGNLGSTTNYKGDPVAATGVGSAIADVVCRCRPASVNLTSAESTITSTNYGRAASDLAKYQVLSQTGISALLHVNGVQQDVLRLVQ